MNPECRQSGLCRLPGGRTRLKPEGDVQRVVRAGRNIRRHAHAFQPHAPDRVVVRDGHLQMEVARDVEQFRG